MSLAASERSVPKANCTLTTERLFWETESTCSTPLIVERASSIVSVTFVSMSSEPAPR